MTIGQLTRYRTNDEKRTRKIGRALIQAVDHPALANHPKPPPPMKWNTTTDRWWNAFQKWRRSLPVEVRKILNSQQTTIYS